jgi:hypothetical protein
VIVRKSERKSGAELVEGQFVGAGTGAAFGVAGKMLANVAANVESKQGNLAPAGSLRLRLLIRPDVV